MVVKVKVVGQEEKTYRRVDRIAAAPGTIHLVNINGLPIFIAALDKLEYIEIEENDSDIKVAN